MPPGKVCGRYGTVTAGQPPAGIAGRAQYGPEAHARAANPASAYHVPVGRAAQLMGDMTGTPGFGGLDGRGRHRAAVRLEPFLDHVRGLLRQAGVIYGHLVPSSPGRAGSAQRGIRAVE